MVEHSTAQHSTVNKMTANLAQVSLSGPLLLSYFLLYLSNVSCLHLCFSCLRLYYCFLLRNNLV